MSSTIATLKARDIHTVPYIRSFVEKDLGGTQPASVFDDALASGYVATTKAGMPYLAQGPFPGSIAIIDFTNPDARLWWKGQIRAMLDKGADGFMNDFGEQVLSDMVFADGTTGVTTHNRYPVLQSQATREAIDELLLDQPDREIFFFTRAGYTDRPGSAAYENATFPGDELNDFGTLAGLPSIIPDMLNRSVGGAYGFTTDIAGYADFKSTPSTKELYIRWTEAAALTPFFRVHNGPLAGPRMPWSYDAETEAIWTEMANLHQSMKPAVDSAWDEAVKTGMPVTRPLWLADPGGSPTSHDDDEWLLGPDVLVAPVIEEAKTEREVWLPAGCWRAHGVGEEVMGRTTITTAAPLGELPWFKRCGAK